MVSSRLGGRKELKSGDRWVGAKDGGLQAPYPHNLWPIIVCFPPAFCKHGCDKFATAATRLRPLLGLQRGNRRFMGDTLGLPLIDCSLPVHQGGVGVIQCDLQVGGISGQD